MARFNLKPNLQEIDVFERELLGCLPSLSIHTG